MSPPPPPPPSAVDQSTVTVLSDRISTLEGRQSAFQSQLAQIAKVLGISAGKQGKHSPVKHLVQTLRDEVDVKVQEARTDLMEEIRTALRDFGAGDMGKDKQQAVSMNTVLEALAGEHEASLARLCGSFKKLLAEEARQRVALEAHVRSQLAQQEEWLQQLEGAFGSSHDPKHDQDFGRKDLKAVDSKLAALERRAEQQARASSVKSSVLSVSGSSLEEGSIDYYDDYDDRVESCTQIKELILENRNGWKLALDERIKDFAHTYFVVFERKQRS
ncbi:unnamed protein product [Peronospora farinosa]|uniref:Syntaxin N-terminal domain-containing protein n=1 Tax=Peronospora farinosa TaxID=134698 RepID=A0ABN8CII8_9STRA|nr:unnamed protein product [Peronospora farinosa]